MAFRTIAAALIMLLGFSDPGQARRDTGIYEEVEKTLAGTHFERPPSFDQRQNLVDRLQRRGVETLTDLHPYLGQSENVRYNTLIAMEHMGNIDDKTLGLIETLVFKANDPTARSVALAVRLVLDNSDTPEAVKFGRAIAPRSYRAALLIIMTWTSQHHSSIAASGEGKALARACLRRMAFLFEVGTYSGGQPISFSMAVEQPPFDDEAYAEEVTRAFLSALRNAGRMTEMQRIGFISSFVIVARGAEVKPRLVEDGLVEIVKTGSDPLVKLILWRLSIEGLAETTSGKKVVAAALKKSPEMAGYAQRLGNRGRGVAGTDAGLKSEIERAFRELRVPPGARFDSTSAYPGSNRS